MLTEYIFYCSTFFLNIVGIIIETKIHQEGKIETILYGVSIFILGIIFYNYAKDINIIYLVIFNVFNLFSFFVYSIMREIFYTFLGTLKNHGIELWRELLFSISEGFSKWLEKITNR